MFEQERVVLTKRYATRLQSQTWMWHWCRSKVHRRYTDVEKRRDKKNAKFSYKYVIRCSVRTYTKSLLLSKRRIVGGAAIAFSYMMILFISILTTGFVNPVWPVYYNVGVLMTTKLNSPFDLERCGPAVDLALEKVNREILRVHNIELHKIQARYVILRSLA